MSVFDKILRRIKLPNIYQDNGDIIAYILELKQSFEKKVENFQPKHKLFDLVQSTLTDISISSALNFIFYKKSKKDKNLWENTFDNKKWYLNESNNSLSDTDAIVCVKQFSKKDKSSGYSVKSDFIAADLPNEDIFLIEVQNSNPDNLVYLKFELENFAKNYLQAKQIYELKEEQKKTEKKYQESEKKVTSANKEKRLKIYELHNLVEASNDIYSILDIKQLINSSLLTIIGQVGFQKAFVLLYNKESKKYNEIHNKGFGKKKFDELKFDLTSPLISYFLKNRTPVYISKLEQNKNLKNFARELKKLGILVVAPMIYSERLQGIIGAGEKLQFQNFTEADFEIFHILVNIISISIGNSHMFQEIKTLSLTDAMTGLHNYRYFEDRLKEELNRAKRHKKNVSLMIMDIDHFKNYNDTLGHQAGDEVLRTIGKVLRETIRDEDIVARYGGEEFCIILPGIEKKGIPILGERVRKKIETEKFFKEEVQPGGQVTISIGTSTFPEDASDYRTLVENADKALYQAKNAGRNQIKVYEENTNGAK